MMTNSIYFETSHLNGTVVYLHLKLMLFGYSVHPLAMFSLLDWENSMHPREI